MKNICVYCASSSHLPEEYYEMARSFGRKMGEKNHNIVFGGYNDGLMHEVAYACHLAGGGVISVIPEIFDHEDSNPGYSDEVYKTKNMSLRKAKMEELADGFVILPGGVGTFDELFEALCLNSIGQMNKPIYVYNYHGFYDLLLEFLRKITKETFMSEKTLNMLKVFEREEEFFSMIGE